MKAFADQLVAFWTELDAGRRVQLALSLIITLGIMIAVGWWSTAPRWTPILEGATEKVVQNAAAALSEDGVSFRKTGTGSLEVAAGDYGLASQAMSRVGVVPSIKDAQDLMVGTSPDLQRWAFVRAREGDLALAINEMDGVASSRVHLVEQRDALFLNDEEAARASVIVSTVPGHRLSQDNVRAITNMVAGALRGLTADQVVVTDDNGTLLTKALESGNDPARMLDELQAYRGQLEQSYINRVKSALEPVLGFNGGYSVTATVDLDLETTERKSLKLDTRGQALVSEQLSETSSESRKPGGIPGVDANTPERPADNDGVTREDSSETTANYRYPTVEEVKRKPAGGVISANVAVLIDSARVQELADASGTALEELNRNIEEAVNAAVGTGENRVSTAKVTFLPFQKVEFEEPSVFDPVLATSFAMDALPWIVALIALVLSFMYVIRPLMAQISAAPKPMSLEDQLAELEAKAGGADEHITIRLRKLIDDFRPIDSNELSGLVSQQPSAAAKVLKQWQRQSG